MTVFDRVNITAVIGAGLCGVAMALSPAASAVPFKTGGYDCVETSAGEAPAPAGACLPLTDMAGVPMALPGPVPVAPPPVVPPVVPPPLVPPPLVPPIPPPVVPPPVVPPLAPPMGAAGGAPVAAPLPVGAPLTEMGGASGKGQPTGPVPEGAPQPGQPIMPGPAG
ncbi:hypothetical protein H7I53_18415 [Mycolicibacterium pulveris]|uniref:Beta-xylosidase n=2 Tax=Mycolicibacterium pulveris TaxID=36813 RepID=A0A7I7US14_MYCPV|nr:hypothetical protein [Mycolicibacterium pulveris]MCV6982187.1 hypothetical protein [Mycolicibacterium pulveris]BBY84167.1 hypothetical protein MPUL_53250 [Mycolicibacterium pulveris]